MPNLTSEVKLLGQGNTLREIKIVRGTLLRVTLWPCEFSFFLNSGASESNSGLQEYLVMFGVLQHKLLAASVSANKINNSEWMLLRCGPISSKVDTGMGIFTVTGEKAGLYWHSEQLLKYWQHLLIKKNRQSKANRRAGKRLPHIPQQLAGRVKTSTQYQMFVLRWQPPVLYARDDRWSDKSFTPMAWWLASVLLLLVWDGMGWSSCLFQL